MFCQQECEALRAEVEDSLDTTAAVQELRNKREQEVAELKKTVDECQKVHEQTLQEVKSKLIQQMQQVKDELENVTKVIFS